MYNLHPFKEHDPAIVIEFMKQHPFAMVIGCADDRPVATQLPLLLEERDGLITLSGHMMRKQDHHVAFEKNPQVLVVFTGPHTYVSATWYSDPDQASTWNYQSVHARGSIHFLDERGLEDVLQRLTLHFENNAAHSSTVFANLSESYRAKLLKSIVAFEIKIESFDNVFKLSQNRDKESFSNIISKLQSEGGDAGKIAERMAERSDQLFPNDSDRP